MPKLGDTAMLTLNDAGIQGVHLGDVRGGRGRGGNSPAGGAGRGWGGRGVAVVVSLSRWRFPRRWGAGGLLVGDGLVLGARGEERGDG
jgi:hypothetical protein